MLRVPVRRPYPADAGPLDGHEFLVPEESERALVVE